MRGGAQARADLHETLALMGVQRLVVGHTQTGSLERGQPGRIALLERGRLIAVDVGLGEGAEAPRAALIIAGSRGLEWTPAGTRVLWGAKRRG